MSTTRTPLDEKRTAPAQARPANSETLIERWLPLVRHVVARLPIPTSCAALDRDDLCQAGAIGLMRAAESWDPNRGASFKTFAYTAIRGAVLDELRRFDPVPRPRRDRLRRMEQVSLDLSTDLGRAPTLEELGQALDVPADLLDEDLLVLHTARRLSLDEFGGANSDELEGGNGRASGSPLGPSLLRTGETGAEPHELAAHRELLERLAEAIGALPERERHCVVLYHHEGLYLKEVAELLGVTESRVCQILARAVARLRLSLSND